LIAGVAIATAAASALAAERPFIFTGRDPLPAPAVSQPVVMPRGEREGVGRVPSWPVIIGENFSSPMFYDLDGDGVMEVITTDRQYSYVFAADGSLWPGWPKSGGSDNIPAVADIDEDGSPEIFIASPGGPPRIRCFNADGTVRPGFPAALPYQNWLNVSCPAIADVDGDGHLDVGAAVRARRRVLRPFGQPSPGWPYYLADHAEHRLVRPAVPT
jgi:hypothetical protein